MKERRRKRLIQTLTLKCQFLLLLRTNKISWMSKQKE